MLLCFIKVSENVFKSVCAYIIHGFQLDFEINHKDVTLHEDNNVVSVFVEYLPVLDLVNCEVLLDLAPETDIVDFERLHTFMVEV